MSLQCVLLTHHRHALHSQARPQIELRQTCGQAVRNLALQCYVVLPMAHCQQGPARLAAGAFNEVHKWATWGPTTRLSQPSWVRASVAQSRQGVRCQLFMLVVGSVLVAAASVNDSGDVLSSGI